MNSEPILIEVNATDGRAKAAVLPTPVSNVQTIYRKLPSAARSQMHLARRWKVWAVLATNAWAEAHASLDTAPTA